jgi:transposase
MENKRRRFNGSFKANVALAAVKGDRTMGELASVFGVHANQITKWKRQSLDGVPGIFSERHREDLRQQEALTDRLYRMFHLLMPGNLRSNCFVLHALGDSQAASCGWLQ